MRILHGVCLILALSFGTGAHADEIDELIEQFFDEAKFIGRIIQDFPEERENAEASLRIAFESGSNETAKQAGFELGAGLAGKYTSHYISKTSDEAVLAYLNMLQLATRELATSDGPACFRWSFAVPGSAAPNFTSDVEQLMLDTQAQVVTEVGDSIRMLDAETFEALSGQIGGVMATHLSSDHLYFDGLTDPGSVQDQESMRKTCLTWWGYLAGISMLSQDDAAAYFRTMMASQ